MADRHRFRADWHDYNSGVYFVTICCRDRGHYFGEVEGGQMRLSPIGVIVREHILMLSSHYCDVEVWNYVVMPNHIHMVIAVGPVFKSSTHTEQVEVRQTACTAPPNANRGCLKPKKYGDVVQDFHHNSALSVIVRCFKGGVKRECSKVGMDFEWQNRFHEHIIRDQQSYCNIMNYIDNNVANWGNDCFNRVVDISEDAYAES